MVIFKKCRILPTGTPTIRRGGVHDNGVKLCKSETASLLRLTVTKAFAMSFDELPDELLPAVFSHVPPGTLIKLTLVRADHLCKC